MEGLLSTRPTPSSLEQSANSEQRATYLEQSATSEQSVIWDGAV